MSHFKIIIIKKRDYVPTASAVQQEWAGCGLFTAGAPASCPAPHTPLTASDPPLPRAALTPFPFLLVQYFPRRELGQHLYLTQSTQGQQGGAPQGAAISAFGQLRNQIWALHKEKSCLWLVKSNVVTPPYPRQRSGTQRSRCRIPPAQDKAQCRLNSLWHMCDLGPL